MARTETPVCEFGLPAPDFSLPGTDGKTHTLQSTRGPNGLLVMFICNHCPYVKSVRDRCQVVAERLELCPGFRFAQQRGDAQHQHADLGARHAQCEAQRQQAKAARPCGRSLCLQFKEYAYRT